MQVFLKPYAHKTFTNVPYSSDKNENAGYIDLYNYPDKIKELPEVKNNPELESLIKAINQHELYTFGCGLHWDPFLQSSGWYEFASWINLAFLKDQNNASDDMYLKLIGTFLMSEKKLENEAVTVDFRLNPTNFHDFKRFSMGVSPKEETVKFRGFSLNINICGFGDDSNIALQNWQQGINFVTEFFQETE